jgi:hypothetical protein
MLKPLDLSPEQRAESLKKAAAARSARRSLLDEIRAGRMDLGDLFAREDEVFLAIPIRTLLLALPGVGVKSADDFLAEARIDRGRRVRGLGNRQRQALLDWVS